MTKNNTFLKIANAVAFAATVTVNILANSLPIGGMNTGQISATYPTLFTPAGFTFSIWGVIYSLLFIFILMQLFSKSMTDTEDTGVFFILSCVFNILWIFAWHSQMIVFSTLLIFALLGTLIKLYNATRNSSIVLKTASGIYYAWITAASMISIFVLVKTLTGNAPVTPMEARGMTAVPYGYSDVLLVAGNPEIVSYVSVFEYIMAIAAIGAITGITVWHMRRYRDYFYTGTILWALGGIMYKQLTAPVQPIVMLVFGVLSVAVILYSAVKIEYDRSKKMIPINVKRARS